MLYSHQLLARKAPLGQIWMAATLHAKFNRKKLDKLDIIQICEEILNPSVPMVFRLYGISMGGVVIVYERKVKLLFDDRTRLLVEINGAWRTKAVPDPTLLLKGKTHARTKAVTLPKNEEADFGDVEQTRNLPKFPSFMEFQRTYISMRLDEPNVNENHEQEDLGQQFHQADADNITLFEYLGAHQTDTETYDRFERFDIEGDDETQINFSAREGAQTPTSLIPSPPRHHDIPEAHQGDEGSMYSIGQKLSIRVGPLKGYLCRLLALRYSDVTMTRTDGAWRKHGGTDGNKQDDGKSCSGISSAASSNPGSAGSNPGSAGSASGSGKGINDDYKIAGKRSKYKPELQNSSMKFGTSIYVDFETLAFQPAFDVEKYLLSEIVNSVQAHDPKYKKYHLADIIGFATMDDKEGEEDIWKKLRKDGFVISRYYTRKMICHDCKKKAAEGGGRGMVKSGGLLQIEMMDRIFRKAQFLKRAGLVDKGSIGIISGDPFFHQVVVSTLQHCGIDAYSILPEGVSRKPMTAAKSSFNTGRREQSNAYGSFNTGRREQRRDQSDAYSSFNTGRREQSVGYGSFNSGRESFNTVPRGGNFFSKSSELSNKSWITAKLEKSSSSQQVGETSSKSSQASDKSWTTTKLEKSSSIQQVGETSRKSEGVNIIWDFGNSWLKEGVTVQMLKPRIQSSLKRHGDFEIKDIYAIGPAGTNFDLIERCADFTMIKIPNLSKRCGKCNDQFHSLAETKRKLI